MNDEKRQDIEFAGEAMALLQEAEEFGIVALVRDENGKTTPRQMVTSTWFLPFCRDMMEQMHRQQLRRLDDNEEGDE